jgi:hypothetical protein
MSIFAMVKNIYERYHKTYLEDFALHCKVQEITREGMRIQFKSQDIFGYMPLSKESFSSYMKLSESGNFLGRT